MLRSTDGNQRPGHSCVWAPQAPITHWPPLPLGGPWLHSVSSPFGMVLHPKGPSVQKPVGQIRCAERLLDRLTVWLSFKQILSLFSQHSLAGEAAGYEGRGAHSGHSPPSTTLSPAAHRITLISRPLGNPCKPQVDPQTLTCVNITWRAVKMQIAAVPPAQSS